MNTDSSQFITGREVTVPDMLNARDRRHAIQQELIRTHGATVISFTLNIPGPVKISRSWKNGPSGTLQEMNSSGL